MICRGVIHSISFALCAVASIASAAAQDFYKGKTLTIVVGSSTGGGFDVNARLLARHIGRHIPGNPAVIVQNMPGAASIKSVQYVDAAAPKDGTVIDIFNFGSIGDSKLDPAKIRVDFRKFSWIGSISQDLTVCYVWHAVGPKTLVELKTRPVVMGRTAVGSSSDVNQHILKNIFGVHIQQVSGYPGIAEERLAIERSEIEGICSAWSSVPTEWIEGAKIVPITRSAQVVPPDLSPQVPYVVDIAANDRDRKIINLLVESGQVGRPFIASLAVPADRIRILRDAFNATMVDPEFVAEAQKLRLPVSPKTGEEALKVVEDIYATPADIVEAAKKIVAE